MTSIKSFLAYLSILVLNLSPTSCSHLTKITPDEVHTPEEAVLGFTQEDASGSQAWSPEWKNKIQPYTIWEDAPGWDSAQVISGYKILNSKINGDKAQVQVQYQVLGQLISGETAFDFNSEPQSQVIEYDLVQSNGKWKIASPQIEPHISVEAATQLLDSESFNSQTVSKSARAQHEKIKAKVRTLL